MMVNRGNSGNVLIAYFLIYSVRSDCARHSCIILSISRTSVSISLLSWQSSSSIVDVSTGIMREYTFYYLVSECDLYDKHGLPLCVRNPTWDRSIRIRISYSWQRQTNVIN